MGVPVILDVDTGVDDTLALLLAARSPELELVGVTCVTGNVTVDLVVRNTLQVLETAGRRDVPVAIGRRQPLLEKVVTAAYVHGEDGLGGLSRTLPIAQRSPEDLPAVDFLVKALLEAETPITLVPLGPLSNIAMLLQEYPQVKSRIPRIVLMGGAFGMGNASAVAEFNIRQDPEAAEIVLTSGVDIVMYTWDVFTQVVFGPSEVQTMATGSGKCGQLAGQLMRFMQQNFGRDMVSIGDAGAVASVIDPSGLTTRMCPVRVELEGRWTRGMTVVDQRPQTWIEKESAWQPSMKTRIAVSTEVDVARFRQIFWKTVVGGQVGAEPA